MTTEERARIISALVEREQLKLARTRTLCAVLIVVMWFYSLVT